MRAALLALGVALYAPYQCGTEPDERPLEDGAPEALWNLAERFRAEEQPRARATTLRQLVERYPSSRFSARARAELAAQDAAAYDGP